MLIAGPAYQQGRREPPLHQVAAVLKVPVDAIKNLDGKAAINIIGNTVTNHDNASVFNYYPTFNPLDKIIELYERMHKEKDELIETLMQGRK